MNNFQEILANRAADRVFAYRETKYRVGTAADMLGTATGGATDWIKKNTPTKYVYVLELPPDMKSKNSFRSSMKTRITFNFSLVRIPSQTTLAYSNWKRDMAWN